MFFRIAIRVGIVAILFSPFAFFAKAQSSGAEVFLVKDEKMTGYNLNLKEDEIGELQLQSPALDEGAELNISQDSSVRVLESGQDEVGEEYLKILINNSVTAWVRQDELILIESIGETLVAGRAFIQPTAGRITGRPGMRRHPILKRMKYHAGTDIAARTGTPIKAAAEGVVTHSGWAGSYGIMVQIQHAGGVVTRYAHMSKALVRKGQRVAQGVLIGKVGSTGRSTGPHLHYERR